MTTAIMPLLREELERESAITRKMLSLVPDDKFSWKPHTKSMSIKQLATHMAELPGWITMVLNTGELDFANNSYNPEDINHTAGVLQYFERTLAEARENLQAAREEQLWDNWKLRNGEKILSDTSKYEMIRITFGQMIHHRAQMGVFLRLLDIKIPGTYGPSADEMGF